MRMTLEDVYGVFAIMPTPAMGELRDWHKSSINTNEARRASSALADAGISGIMCNGTLGECSTLTAEEHVEFASAVVEGAGGRSKVLVGPTMGSTKTTIQRAALLADTGIDGLLLGRPMWNALTGSEIVRFYRDVAEALPDLAIIVYDNPVAFKGPIGATSYGLLSDIPQVIASKLTVEGALTAESDGTYAAVGEGMRLLPLDAYWSEAYQRNAAASSACWSSAASCGPSPVIALESAIIRGDFDTAARISEEINAVRRLSLPRGSQEELAQNPVCAIKPMVAEAGFMDPGPPRPPHDIVPDYCLDSARLAGRRWKSLHDKYEEIVRTSAAAMHTA